MKQLLRICVAVLTLLLGLSLLLHQKLPEIGHHHHHHHHNADFLRTKPRIAVLLPLVGEAPSYLELFCTGAEGSASLVDFYILHNGAVRSSHLDCPSNVYFVNYESTAGLAEKLVKVVDHVPDDKLEFPREKLKKMIARYLDQAPYALVEWKMALGHVFQDILVGGEDANAPKYSHWAYADLDIVFGDLPRWVTVDEFEYDIVTYGFGDQHRLYPRGQFTIHRNTPKVNTIWKSCEFLSRLDSRWMKILNEDAKQQFESAEGCYSVAILNRTDISVKYAVKAWTDQKDEDSVHSHGVYLSRSKKHPGKHVLYKARSPATGEALLDLEARWFERDLVYSDKNQDLQVASGERSALQLPISSEFEAKKCGMFWIRNEYEAHICLPETAVSSTDTIYWIHGELFKEPHTTVPLENDAVVTAPFYHFQDWKRYYMLGHVSSMHRSSPASTFVLTPQGSIPIFSDAAKMKTSSPLGIALKKNVWVEASDTQRSQFPSRDYCLASLAAKHPPRITCDLSTNWNDTESLHIASGAPEWSNGKISTESDVTLVLTLQISPSRHDRIPDLCNLLMLNIQRWRGQPCVVVIYLASATQKAVIALHKAFEAMEPDLANVLMAVVSKKEEDGVSRNALINMAADVVPTRWFVQGVEIERGIVLSLDSVALAHKSAAAHNRYPGHLFWIPQFALANDDESDVSVLASDLLTRRSGGSKVSAPSHVERLCEDQSAPKEAWDTPNTIWWDLTEKMVEKEKSGIDLDSLSSSLEHLQLDALERLVDGNDLDESPIVMIDNQGPGWNTNLAVRNPEPLGGRRCYNLLYLWQLIGLGYRLNVIPGAFGVSDQKTRHVNEGESEMLGDSRCDGCFLFEKEDEKLVNDYVKQEVARISKTAVIWAEEARKR